MSVQATIIKGITTLLRQQDFVVLPDFGGFILKSKPAHFSESGKQLLPPTKHLSFNIQTKQNDGVLVAFLQTELACEYAVALQHVKDFTAYCQFVLQAKRRISLEGIGFFYLDFEGNTCFEPQRDLNFLPESFGLESIQLLEPISLEKSAPLRYAPEFEDRPAVQSAPSIKRKVKIRPIYISTLMLLLLCTIVVMLISERKVSGQLQAALGIPTGHTSYVQVNYPALKLQTVAATPVPYITDANGIAMLSINNSAKLAVAADEHKLAEVGNAGGAKFELVFGCFAKPSNAKRLVKKLGLLGMRARISNKLHKGMQVVCSKSFSDKAEANLALEKIHNSQPNAWLREIE